MLLLAVSTLQILNDLESRANLNASLMGYSVSKRVKDILLATNDLYVSGDNYQLTYIKSISLKIKNANFYFENLDYERILPVNVVAINNIKSALDIGSDSLVSVCASDVSNLRKNSINSLKELCSELQIQCRRFEPSIPDEKISSLGPEV